MTQISNNFSLSTLSAVKDNLNDKIVIFERIHDSGKIRRTQPELAENNFSFAEQTETKIICIRRCTIIGGGFLDRTTRDRLKPRAQNQTPLWAIQCQETTRAGVIPPASPLCLVSSEWLLLFYQIAIHHFCTGGGCQRYQVGTIVLNWTSGSRPTEPAIRIGQANPDQCNQMTN